MKKNTEIINILKSRKLEYFGQVMRHPENYQHVYYYLFSFLDCIN